MARTAIIQREKKRDRLVEQYAARRAELLAAASDPNNSFEVQMKARRKLDKLPRNSSKVRGRRRCRLTGRPRGNLRVSGMSRSMFRDIAMLGLAPGVRKSSW